MRALVRINGWDLPEPSSYTATTSTMVDSARNVNGYVVGSVVREDVAKIELKWNYLTAELWSNILTCFNSKLGGSFYNDITFFNQVTNNWETRTFYVNDRKAPIFKRNPITGAIDGYLGATLNLIEV